MSEPFIGEIKMFAGNFAPRGYMMCNGQILSIAQNTALFSILGTTYGGNGQTTFALPNLQSRVPIHAGQGPGLSLYVLGEMAGTETVTMTQAQMPAHTHVAVVTPGGGNNTISLPCSTNPGDSDSPAGRIPAISSAGEEQYTDATSANAQTAPVTVNVSTPTVTNGISGSNLPVPILQPFLAINYIIAINGIFPSRN
ncbi:phage tail protein [Luteolibacter luteus]|uniref:Phage tail protein n=1 Tax=Luteolibacter luteus TaxID=2728835 RepID=A0A858RNR6_9BACT|nr:tail fiber protein [Luteolibacter luteus]QJE98144.1 phage tail protein [Luteolibacter luteus]